MPRSPVPAPWSLREYTTSMNLMSSGCKQRMVTTPFSATTTIMADFKVWCLLIDPDHKPSFGEPFPVPTRLVDKVHELKIKIRNERNSNLYPICTFPNRIEIWKCASPKLSAKDSFYQTKEILDEINFSGNWKGHVQHLGPAQKAKELELEDNSLR